VGDAPAGGVLHAQRNWPDGGMFGTKIGWVFPVIAFGSAFALYRELVDYGSAEPAPERIQRDFEFLQEHTAAASSRFGGPKFTPEGPAREVMRVHIDGETRPLWVVPTRDAGRTRARRARGRSSLCSPPLSPARRRVPLLRLHVLHDRGRKRDAELDCQQPQVVPILFGQRIAKSKRELQLRRDTGNGPAVDGPASS
jgi:hypothetical protein